MSHSDNPAQPLTASASTGLSGTVRAPGDKSISHRALILGALSVGETLIAGLLEGEDVLNTAAAVRALGAEANALGDGAWQVFGVGVGGRASPEKPLDFGNSGTGARLMMGVVAGHPISAMFTGDSSLSGRPMGRVIDPLSLFGAEFTARDGGKLPLTIAGASHPVPVSYASPVASAQVKSAVLLAGLNTPGQTTVIEKVRTRDHTERMLRHFGATVEEEQTNEGWKITLTGQPELVPATVHVPSDPSSAAFPVVAALITPGSEVTLTGVGMNSHRIGLFDTLIEMGADLTIANRRVEAGEPVADLTARASKLHGVEVPTDRSAAMIDEYPVLCAAAAVADGATVMRGIEELRVKESDRIDAMVRGLRACGVAVEEHDDGMTVTGGPVPGGATVQTHLDHRIAMSFLVLGLVAQNPVTVDDGAPIATSFPDFVSMIQGLGGHITGAE